MDTLAAFSLATEPPQAELKLSIIKVEDRIITPIMWRNILS